jgi:hypothetical protein
MLNTPLFVVLYVKKPLAYFQRGNKWNIVFSFGQTYPLKKGIGGKRQIFFFYIRERERERERESEFTQENGCNILSIMWIILAWIGGRGQEENTTCHTEMGIV